MHISLTVNKISTDTQTWTHHQCCFLESLGVLGLARDSLLQATRRGWSDPVLCPSGMLLPPWLSPLQPEPSGGFFCSFHVVEFLGTTITNDLKWETNTCSIIKRAHSGMFFLRQLRKLNVSRPVLTQFYRATTESIISSSISVWFGSVSALAKNRLQTIVRTEEKLTGQKQQSVSELSSLTPLTQVFF